MPDTSAKYGFTQPFGNENYSVAIQNANWDIAEQYLGTTICTSTTRPSSPKTGQAIFETNTELEYVWDGDSWAKMTPAIPTIPTIPTIPPGYAMAGNQYSTANSTLLTMAANTNEQLTTLETPTLSYNVNTTVRVTALVEFSNGTASGEITFRIRSDTVTGTLHTVRIVGSRVATVRQVEMVQGIVVIGSGGFNGKFVLTAQKTTSANSVLFYKSTTSKPFMMSEQIGNNTVITQV